MNTDNQQQTVNDLELGWLIGIIEGEGSITLQLSRQRRCRIGGVPLRVDPRVVITNTDQQIIEKCVDILDRLGVGKWVTHTRANSREYLATALVKKRHKDITYINVQGFKRVAKLLNHITFGMAGEKKTRCEVLARFLAKRVSEGGRGEAYDRRDVELMLEFLRLTKSKNLEKIEGMLNEHTRDGRIGPRSDEWKAKNLAGRIAAQTRRCALDSQETVRVGQK